MTGVVVSHMTKVTVMNFGQLTVERDDAEDESKTEHQNNDRIDLESRRFIRVESYGMVPR